MKKKRKKIKTWFKIFLILLLSSILIYFLIKENYINIDFSKYFIKTNNFNEEIKKKDEEELDTMSSIFKNRLKSIGWEYASSSQISPDGDIKIFIKGSLNEEGYIYVNTKSEENYVWNTFMSVIKSDKFSNKIKNVAGLEYIDLRFSNKVFYKFKDINTDLIDIEKENNNPFLNSEKQLNGLEIIN